MTNNPGRSESLLKEGGSLGAYVVRSLLRRCNMKWVVLLVFLLAPLNLLAADSKARNVFLLTIDGLRWQEVFRGRD